MPAGPEPMIATRRPVGGSFGHGMGAGASTSSTRSAQYRCESRMAMAVSTSSRRQCVSHGAGQTRPRMAGKGSDRFRMRVASSQLPRVFCFR